MDRLLRDGRLPNGRRVDIQITDGLISGVVDSGEVPTEGVETDDLRGWLVLTAMAAPPVRL